VKRIPPSVSATAIFAAQYVRSLIPDGFFTFTVMQPEGRWERE
jgi:hypothetical protein